MPLRTRIAPTPSGFLHWGNAFSFVLTWLIARKQKGQLVLRIDDLDSTRKRPEYVNDVFESLDWLGLDVDEGPSGPDEFEAKYTQHRRLELYHEAMNTLADRETLFGCACTRSTIQRESTDGQHPPSCRQNSSPLHGAQIAWRIKTPPTPIEWTDRSGKRNSVDLSQSMRDFIVRRKDGLPSYQLASVVDDDHFQINHIVRGEDLLESTASQRFLASELPSSSFRDNNFVHHPLVKSPHGEKLSKSAGAASLKAMREIEASPARVYRQISKLLGFQEPIESASAALAVWQNDLSVFNNLGKDDDSVA